jgi:hypothetical protein
MSGIDPQFSPRRRQLLAGAIAAGLVASQGLPAQLFAGTGAPLTADALRAAQLLAVCRTLFPHAFLADADYLACVAKIDARVAADPAAASALAEGVAALPAHFATLDQAAREAALAPLAGTPFFKIARQSAASVIYYLPGTWRALRYPGPSAPFGGYVDRPLVELAWLEGARA